MCGIVHVKKLLNSPACKTVLKRFNKQRSRGTEGFGYVAVEGNKIVSVKNAKHESEIREMIMKETASEIMFHHRMPTSTPNYVGASHPIIIRSDAFDYDYLFIHNGVIQNSDALKKDHEALGIEYATEYTSESESVTETTKSLVFNNGFIEEDSEPTVVRSTTKSQGYNDSESLGYELALYLEGWQESIGTRGGAATMIYQLEKDGDEKCIGATVRNMYYGSNSGRPLVLELQGTSRKKKKDGVEMIIIKSEGNGTEIETDRMFYVSYAEDGSRDISSKDFEFGFSFKKSTANATPTQNAYAQSRVGFNNNKEDDREPDYSNTDEESVIDLEDVDATFPPRTDFDAMQFYCSSI